MSKIYIYTKEEVLKLFIENYFDLVTKMNEINHGYNNNYNNNVHLEGTIWTHSMMVLNQAQPTNIQIFSALCHDIGKCFVPRDIDKGTTKSTEKEGRRRFNNHEAVSVFYAKGVLEKIGLYLTHKEKEAILFVVANHGRLYPYFEDGSIPEKNYKKIAGMFKNKEYFRELTNFYIADHNGRFNFSDNYGADMYKLKENFRDIYGLIENSKSSCVHDVPDVPVITLLIGPPRSGKSTAVESILNNQPNGTNIVVISRDQTLMDYWKEISELDLSYQDVFKNLTDDDQKEINKRIQNQFQTATKAKENIIIDMTNMSKKTRKKWLLKNYYKKAIVFIESRSCLLSRNTPEKFIQPVVIDSMLERFVYPMYDEFDEIEQLTTNKCKGQK